MANQNIKKVRIPYNELPPINTLTEGYNIRYRFVSDDRNRTSHWSPIYNIFPNYTFFTQGINLQLPENSSVNNFSWDSVDILKEADSVTDITYKQISNNLATITTGGAHYLNAGDTVVISNVDGILDGKHKILSTSTTTFSFYKEYTNVPLTSVTPNGTYKKMSFVDKSEKYDVWVRWDRGDGGDWQYLERANGTTLSVIPPEYYTKDGVVQAQDPDTVSIELYLPGYPVRRGNGTPGTENAPKLKVYELTEKFKKYMVTYNSNGSTSGAPPIATSLYLSGSDVVVSGGGTLEKTGFIFNKWNTKADGSGTSYYPGNEISNISEDVYLYAQWTNGTISIGYFDNTYSDTSGNNINYPYDIKKDSNGNKYLVGQLNSDSNNYSSAATVKSFIYKYNSLINVDWQLYLDSPYYANQFSIAYGSTIDAYDNIYVTGHIINDDEYSIGYLQKYNSSGALLWQRYLGGYPCADPLTWIATECGPDGSVQLYKTVVDSSNNVYVCGEYYELSTGIKYALVAKYNQFGILQWQRTLSIGVGADTIAFSICIDSSDNIYVCGNAVPDFFLAKYNSSGILQWQRILEDSNGGYGGMAVDSSDNIYIASVYNLTSGVKTIKYDSSGTLQWQKNTDKTSVAIEFHGIYINSNDEIYLTGYYDNDGFIVKYNDSGFIIWQKILSGPNIILKTILEDNESLFVGGVFNDGSLWQTLSLRLASSGITLGSYSVSGPNQDYLFTYSVGDADLSNASLVDSAGSLTDAAGSLTSADASLIPNRFTLETIVTYA